MRIQEAARQTGCTCRAIKFYEEKGLLPRVSRRENGYRDYSDEDVALLHQISAYRKLGVSIGDIRSILVQGDESLLHIILAQKKQEQLVHQGEIEALERFIQCRDMQAFNASVDHASIEKAIITQIPGCIGRYLAAHFSPYLNISITTKAQQDAYQRILDFWDRPSLRLPLPFRISCLLSLLIPAGAAPSADALAAKLEPDEESYARLKEQTYKIVRARENLLVRCMPFETLKRSMMRGLRDCGYYDVFLPALEQFSPPYHEYRQKLRALNDRLCKDLNLYYDSDYNLRILDNQKAGSARSRFRTTLQNEDVRCAQHDSLHNFLSHQKKDR